MLKKQGRVLCFSANRKISLPPKQRKGVQHHPMVFIQVQLSNGHQEKIPGTQAESPPESGPAFRVQGMKHLPVQSYSRQPEHLGTSL